VKVSEAITASARPTTSHSAAPPKSASSGTRHEASIFCCEISFIVHWIRFRRNFYWRGRAGFFFARNQIRAGGGGILPFLRGRFGLPCQSAGARCRGCWSTQPILLSDAISFVRISKSAFVRRRRAVGVNRRDIHQKFHRDDEHGENHAPAMKAIAAPEALVCVF
jgi:hypothetical protein